MNLLKPPTLKPGATLGIVAPSMPILPSDVANYETGKRTLEQLGFRLKEGQTVSLRRWWSAGTAEQQAADINAMFADPEVSAIVAVAGGFSSMHVVDLIDYELIRRNPKPFIGMSDITLYQWGMLTQCGLVGFQGNCVVEGFGEFFVQAPAEHQQIVLDLYRRLLTVREPLGALPQLTPWECWRSGQAEGRLLGGVLRRFVTLAGTPYFPPLSAFDGAILFFEEIGETLYDITFNLAKLRHLGVLERIGGMLIGKLTWVNQFFEEIEHPSPREAILHVLDRYSFPILAEVDFGHRQLMLPLPIGARARMDSDQPLLEIVETVTTSED